MTVNLSTVEFQDEFDVIVVGAGHSGCEAALAAARLGCRTLMLTLNLDKIAWQPCNPAVGAPAKSQLVHEVDALGGDEALTSRAPASLTGAGVRAAQPVGRHSALKSSWQPLQVPPSVRKAGPKAAMSDASTAPSAVAASMKS